MIKAYADIDVDSLSSAERATVEAEEEEKQQSGNTKRYEHYLSSQCGDTISLTNASFDDYLTKEALIKTMKPMEQKELCKKWWYSRWYDGIAFNKYHIEVQRDIRKNNDDIDDHEMTIKNQTKTYHADLWQVEENNEGIDIVYLWEVKPESYEKEPNKTKGENQLEKYINLQNKTYAGNSNHKKNFADSYFTKGGYIKSGEFYFLVTVKHENHTELLLYDVFYKWNSNSLITYHFDRYYSEPEKETQTSTGDVPIVDLSPESFIIKLLLSYWLYKSNGSGNSGYGGAWDEPNGGFEIPDGWSAPAYGFYAFEPEFKYDMTAIIALAAAAGAIWAMNKNNTNSVSATMAAACEQFVIKISPYMDYLNGTVPLPLNFDLSELTLAVDDFLLSLELYVSESLAQQLREAMLAGDSKRLTELLKELGLGEEEFNKATGAQPSRDPLVIDLGEEGIELHSIENGVYFDLDNNGFAEKTAWIGTEDGFLAYDRNNNQKIDNGGELFGDQVILQNGTKSVSGFDALKELDNDRNGYINSADGAYQLLLVWIDSNHNGKSEHDELFSLSDLGIEKISLDYSVISLFDIETGTRIADTADVTITKGITQIREFWFPVKPSDSIHNNKNTVGNVPDIMQAIEEDKSGVLKGYFEKFSEATEVSTKYYYLKKILYFITDSENIEPDSRGSNIDARDLHVIERFMGREFIGIDGKDPNTGAASILKDLYNRIEEDYYCALNMHCALGGYLNATYESEDENGNNELHLDFLNQILKNKKSNGENIDYILYDLGIYLKVYDRMNGTTSYQDYADTYESENPYIVNSIKDKYTYVCADDDDNYVGTAFNDNIFGLDGNDKLNGSNGNDLLCGGSGNDILYGNIGNDDLYGEDGNDVIYGDSGNDILDGGAGNDILYGGYDDDTYIFGRGYGQDTIDEQNKNSGADKIVFGEGITVDDIILGRDGDDMILTIKGTDDSIRIVKQYMVIPFPHQSPTS